MPIYRIPLEFEAEDDEEARGLADQMAATVANDESIYTVVREELSRQRSYFERLDRE